MDGVALLVEAEAAGLDVLAGNDGRLIVRGPRSADALARRLLAHKANVLAALAVEEPPAVLSTPSKRTSRSSCRCGSTQTVDVPIHAGQSTRRDCAKCGRFVSFSVWYGKPTKDAK